MFRCREADPYDFNESWCSGRVSGVDSIGEVRFHPTYDSLVSGAK